MITIPGQDPHLSLLTKKKNAEELTDEQLIAIFLETCSSSRFTHRNYKKAIEMFRAYTSYAPLRDVTWREIEAFKLRLMKEINAETGRPYEPATVAGILSALRSLFRWCCHPQIGMMKDNPTANTKNPKVQITSAQHYLTKRELSILFRQLKKQGIRNYALGLSLAMLGLRVSELVAMRWEDFHTDPLESSVWLTVKKGKGDKIREIKVPGVLWDVLGQYRSFYPKDVMEEGHRVFPISARWVEKIIGNARDASGLTKKVTPHWLRHTNATLALLSGASLQQVQEMLGHSHMNTTQRYLHTVNQLKKTASDYVGEHLKDIL
ncbi:MULTISPECIES: tyrosine-type recombinase/integrase [unclassified Paenibacillus]|uniref:tyrosine-type recombinase/integrase n=1 Tax=unclassified Paenibacillus TaxID=185978 RepID=UPI000953C284|nr:MULTISPECIES: tyrosine-type recombinase/integrase [unclassified Paenibacillus]ASS66580.1 tyrosine-type recombinase/integrase [Paenibacillus sp. RUD330]SIQ01851.1 integrase/recombinase XerD [Paenibacillus sp. RU4X]SIQ21234.1 integrase/recombinase XerD [Paenibacillus sp. RU4T]